MILAVLSLTCPRELKGPKVWFYYGVPTDADTVWTRLADDTLNPYLYPVPAGMPLTITCRAQSPGRRMRLGPFGETATAMITA